jgi:putative addiction module component (TIGR02574 family)
MAQSLPIPPPGFDALSVEEKIEYVNSLWDRIAIRPEEVPVPDWHRQILEERLARDDAHPE